MAPCPGAFVFNSLYLGFFNLRDRAYLYLQITCYGRQYAFQPYQASPGKNGTYWKEILLAAHSWEQEKKTDPVTEQGEREAETFP